MAEYDSAIALADRLITKKGLTVTLLPSNTDVKAVRIPVKFKRTPDGDWQRFEEHYLLPASQVPFELDKTMQVKVQGRTYGIMQLEPLRPNEQTIIWKLWLEG